MSHFPYLPKPAKVRMLWWQHPVTQRLSVWAGYGANDIGLWVERAFEDAKSECGMAYYQVRKWCVWHHHMALVMMAILFMLCERIPHKDTYPLLSCAHIEELLARFLPVVM